MAPNVIDDRDSSVEFTGGRWDQRWGVKEEYNSTTSLATAKGMSVTLHFNGKHPNLGDSNIMCVNLKNK